MSSQNTRHCMRKGNTIQGASEQSYNERASLINKENSSIQGQLVVAGQQANLAILANLIEIIDIAPVQLRAVPGSSSGIHMFVLGCGQVRAESSTEAFKLLTGVVPLQALHVLLLLINLLHSCFLINSLHLYYISDFLDNLKLQ